MCIGQRWPSCGGFLEAEVGAAEKPVNKIGGGGPIGKEFESTMGTKG